MLALDTSQCWQNSQGFGRPQQQDPAQIPAQAMSIRKPLSNSCPIHVQFMSNSPGPSRRIRVRVIVAYSSNLSAGLPSAMTRPRRSRK